MIRDCGGCGQSDEHPRHVVGVVLRPGAVAPTPMHIDCCAAGGCELCAQTLADADGARGQDLIDHLAALRAAQTEEHTHG